MDIKLIVRESFANYQIGDEITNPAEIAAILESENAEHVIKVAISE
jgi:hypothetical protein